MNRTRIQLSRTELKTKLATTQTTCQLVWQQNRHHELPEHVRTKLYQNPIFKVRLSVARNQWFLRHERIQALTGTVYPLGDYYGQYGGHDLFDPLHLHQLHDLNPLTTQELQHIASSQTPEIVQWVIIHPTLTQNRTDLWPTIFTTAARTALQQPKHLQHRWITTFTDTPTNIYPEMSQITQAWQQRMFHSKNEPNQQKWKQLAENKNLGFTTLPLLQNNPNLLEQARQRSLQRIQTGARLRQHLQQNRKPGNK